jgi:hypothetical protein
VIEILESDYLFPLSDYLEAFEDLPENLSVLYDGIISQDMVVLSQLQGAVK